MAPVGEHLVTRQHVHYRTFVDDSLEDGLIPKHRLYPNLPVKNQNNSDNDNLLPESERTSYPQTLMNLLNGIIGCGVLSMPIAFHHGGWLLALIGTPLIGLVSCYCIHLLLAVNVSLMRQTGKGAPFDYHETAEQALLSGPKRLRKYSSLARNAVITTLTCTQVGACCVYYVFIATNLRTFLVNRLGAHHAPTEAQCLALILPLLIAINCIRSLRYLSYLSTLSNILQVLGIGIILFHIFSRPLQNPSALPQIGQKLPQYFVTTLFIFEGSSVSMSLFKASRQPGDFQQPLGVLNLGELLVAFVYTSLGFFGYLQFGANTQGTLTASLPAELLYDIVQLCYAIVVLGTYPVLLYAPVQVLWPMLKRLIDGNGKCGQMQLQIANLAFRAALVLTTYLLAVVVPQLDLIISLVGAATSSSIAVIIPSILHTVTFWKQRKGLAKLHLLSTNLVLFLVGLCAFILGLYFSLVDILDLYHFTATALSSSILPARLLYAVWILGALILSNSYGGCFYSILAVPEYEPPIDTIADIARIASTDSGYLITLGESAYLQMFLSAPPNGGNIFHQIGQHMNRTKQYMMVKGEEAIRAIEGRPRTSLICTKIYLMINRHL